MACAPCGKGVHSTLKRKLGNSKFINKISAHILDPRRKKQKWRYASLEDRPRNSIRWTCFAVLGSERAPHCFDPRSHAWTSAFVILHMKPDKQIRFDWLIKRTFVLNPLLFSGRNGDFAIRFVTTFSQPLPFFSKALLYSHHLIRFINRLRVEMWRRSLVRLCVLNFSKFKCMWI